MIKSILATVLCSVCSTLTAATIDLAGQWQFQLDRKDEGLAAHWWGKHLDDTIVLPTTTSRAGKGDALTLKPTLDKASLVHLHQKYSYVGPAWYRRSVEIPDDWKDKDVELSLERVIWQTKVWVNGEPVGMQDSLTTPHRFDITRALKAGKNEIAICIDNRKKLEIGIGHAYTDETQTIWNGAIGKLQLEARDCVRVEHLQVRPNLERGGVEVTISMHNGSGANVTAELSLQADPQNFSDSSFMPVKQTLTLSPGEGSQTVFYSMGKAFQYWSEFNPKVYSMKATLDASGSRSEAKATFGMREFKASGRHLMINGQPTFLRGTLECCIFPETAHPAMDEAKWEKIFSTVKAYGLNFIRFHSWCPPEAAFRVADRTGVYLQIELPNWSSKMGQAPLVDTFFQKEGERMIREYGNHPSWVMFSMGNELLGDFHRVDDMVAQFRQLDPMLLYTSTSYSFARTEPMRGWLPGPQDDYFISQETKSGWVRGQGFLNNTKPNTISDYSEGLACLKIPLVSHEVGQYNVYPNLAEIPKYKDSPLRPLGYEAIKTDLEKKGRLADAPLYTRDSGKLAVLLYKEDIERALRTQDQAGIALLDLHDFPGQSTATVGLLDAFWDSKGLIEPEQFRRFCSPIVPLIRMAKMTFENSETFEAGVEIANFGPSALTNAVVSWKLCDADQVVGQGEFKMPLIAQGNGIQLGRIAQPLSAVQHAAKLKITVEISGTAVGNDWSVWVYPAKEATPKNGEVAIFEAIDQPLFKALRQGRRVLLLPEQTSLKSPLDGRFIPVFWSPLHFPNQPGTLGATIDPSHPVWADFPTGTHTDWQWWELLSRSFAVDLDSVPVKPEMPFQFVDKYNRNALPAAIFEAKVGAGRLLVCTLDITRDLDTRIAARQLRRSVLNYMSGDHFKPKAEWSEETLKSLVSPTRSAVKASSANAAYPAAQAVDGDPNTFWHTDWQGGPALPAEFTLALQRDTIVTGFTYLPRQNSNRGRIGQYEMAVSADGKKWMTCINGRAFPNTKEKQTVKFEQPIKARFMRLTALTDLGNSGNAAIAEIAPLVDETAGDVRNLGIVPGFNDNK